MRFRRRSNSFLANAFGFFHLILTIRVFPDYLVFFSLRQTEHNNNVDEIEAAATN